MKIHAVIGAQFGDEGKGLITDTLANENTLVIRFNGGAQAGHTVVTPGGRRHEFHHVGAGTFQGADTLLSRFFIVNPILAVQELDELKTSTHIYVDPRCRVTTPFDMLINRVLENARGDKRHGSCGLGIHETVVRSDNPAYVLYANDLAHPTLLQDKLLGIQEYADQRSQEFGLGPIGAAVPHGNLIPNFMEWCQEFVKRVHIVPDLDAMNSGRHLLFEGAQGLELDEVNGTFPHVTHSRTGLTNVLDLLRMAVLFDPLHVVYVTRCYTTRHGAGPLVNEMEGHPFGWSGPETNVDNAFQGPLRYAPLNHNRVWGNIHWDITGVLSEGIPISHSIAVTCLDQAPLNQIKELIRPFGLRLSLMSMGPTREHVLPANQHTQALYV